MMKKMGQHHGAVVQTGCCYGYRMLDFGVCWFVLGWMDGVFLATAGSQEIFSTMLDCMSSYKFTSSKAQTESAAEMLSTPASALHLIVQGLSIVLVLWLWVNYNICHVMHAICTQPHHWHSPVNVTEQRASRFPNQRE